MLLRHSTYYLIARGLPGLVSFVALAVYTRLLTAEEFGRYSLVLGGAGLIHVVVFQWLQLVLARFLPMQREAPQQLLQSLLALFGCMAAGCVAIGAITAIAWPHPGWRSLILLAVPLVVAQAWLQLNLSLASAELAPARYGRLLGARSVFALGIGGCLAWLGLGDKAPLLGLLSGCVLAWMAFGMQPWKGLRARWPQQAALREYSVYGLPLMVTFALGWVVASSDRFLIAWYLDESATGIYSVGYDLAQQTLGLVLAVINTAAYPLAMRALEARGESAARDQLARNGELIFSCALAGAAALIALGPLLVEIFIGEAFRSGALEVLPWVAVAAAVGGIKAFHIDLAFQLARRSNWQAYTSVLAAVLNVVLNVILIPRAGIVGAAWATVAALSLAAVLSGWLAAHSFRMPAYGPLVARGLSVGVLMYAGAKLGMLAAFPPVAALGAGIALGSLAALLGAVAVNVAGSRNAVAGLIR